MVGMMGARSYEISIIINSIFEKTGVNQAIKSLHMLANQGSPKKINKEFEQLQVRTDNIKQAFNDLAPIAWKMGVPFKNLHNSLQNVNVVFDENGKMVDAITNDLVDNKEATRRLSLANQRFHMELLSVMFAGMALKRAMQSLLKPSQDMVGVTGIWSDTLALFFLPAALDSLNWAIAFEKAALDLNKATDGWAGRIAGWGANFLAITGDVLAFVGQIGLAAKGFETLKNSWGGVKGLFSKINIMSFARSGWDKIDGALGTLKDWGLKGVSSISKTLNTVFTRSGWTDRILPALNSLKDWGFSALVSAKDFTINAIMSLKDKVTAGITSLFGAGTTMKGLMTKGAAIKIGITLAIVAIGWEVGTTLGDWLNEQFKQAGIWHPEQGYINPWQETIAKMGYFDQPQKTVNAIEETFKSMEPEQNPVSLLQYGGIVTKPTLGMIGESGPEAVIPLDKANEYFSFSPTINVTAGSNVDISMLKSQLSDMWFNELKTKGLR